MGLLCSINQSNPKSWGYFDQTFMQIYKQGPLLFYPKNKLQEVMKKKYVLHTGMQG